MTNNLSRIKAQILAHGERESVRFIICCAFNSALSFLLYVSGIMLGFSYIIANGFAWTVSIVVAFSLQSRFVFRKAGEIHRRFPAFMVSNVLSLVVSMGMLSLLIRVLSVNPILASIFTVPVLVIMNFVAGKFIVFA